MLLSCDLLTWTQTFALSGRCVPPTQTLRHWLVAIAARITRSAGQVHLGLDRHWPWGATVAHAVTTLQAIPDPA